MKKETKKTKKSDFQKIFLDVMMACTKTGYNQAITEMQIYIEKYNGHPDELPVKLMARNIDMMTKNHKFDWNLFEHFKKLMKEKSKVKTKQL